MSRRFRIRGLGYETRVGSTQQPITVERQLMSMGHTHSVNDIRTAIRELSTRAQLARKEGRTADASEIEERIARYREELAQRP
ncbi:hypothetical protein AWC31_30600 [Mycolicibacterium wolinskyi]|uniref:Uncharacterized protein n=2 Tax=Mycobacteriaceae TaxID=1762 RepID=A0A1X2F1T3_9MYCO|nr:hypothetical protein AWC31_30600 [Mycolicibacterium wolinskyi]